jgi:alanine racemase
MYTNRAEIHVKALRHNVDGIRKKVGANVKIMGIVKGNAYGHGIIEVAKALTSFHVDYLGVGFLSEGIVLREAGIQTPILVLGGVLGSQIQDFLRHDLDITVASLEIAERIEYEVGRKNSSKARTHIKIDTGMERIGVHSENAVKFIQHVSQLKHLDIVGLYSHFATADEKEKSYAKYQLKRFTSVIDAVRKLGLDIPCIHIANSGAILDLQESYFTMVRPGIMLYGIYPSKETSESVPLQPVLSLKSKVVFIKEVQENTSISYGRKYYTKTRTKIATVPIGYGDGYSRRLTNRTEVLIKGKRYPVVGTICMDQCMVDVGVGTEVHVGDDATLVGNDGNESISAWNIADTLGTIPYEVLTGITSRVPRVLIQ